MNNIFEGAKFGDKFKTRDGRIALFVSLIRGEVAELIVDGEHYTRKFYLVGVSFYGITNADIIGKWEEPIDEEELDRLAYVWAEKSMDDFKCGFRKAKEML